MRDDLGNRLKVKYERATQQHVQQRTHLIIRLDGKAFHTFTRKAEKPHDLRLSVTFNVAVSKLCKSIDGAKFAYLQSDEVSILVTDFATKNTSMWLDGNVQKICSISSSILTAEFNNYLKTNTSFENTALAYFDSRVFTISDPVEVYNYFVWRQQDCTRNSINSMAQTLYSHKQLQGKNCNELQELIFQKGTNWNDLSTEFKRGKIIKKEEGKGWSVDLEIPIFTQSDYIQKLLPTYGY